VVGDVNPGYSLRNGFEVVDSDYDTFDHANAGAVLKKIGLVISGKVGGVSGPIWGTAFLRAAAVAGDRTELTGEDVITMLRAAITGIMARGGASLGEKTLDALVPATDSLEWRSIRDAGRPRVAAIQRAADAASRRPRTPANAAMRPCRVTGERSRGLSTPATAIGVILQAIASAWREKYAKETRREEV
jgi:dihydroxyacetone kinase